MEKRKNSCDILLARYKKSRFCIVQLQGMKSGYILRKFCKESLIVPGAPSTSTARPSSSGRKTMLCVRWDGRCAGYYKLLKLEETVNTKRYQQQFIDSNRSLLEKRSERGRTEGGYTKSFFLMTMLHHIRKNRFATLWKHSAGEF